MPSKVSSWSKDRKKEQARKLFLKAEGTASELDISKPYACKLMQEISKGWKGI